MSEEGKRVEKVDPLNRYTLWAIFLAATLMIVATQFTQAHFMETKSTSALLLFLLSGFIAVLIGLKIAASLWPQHSPAAASLLLACTFAGLMAWDYRTHGELWIELLRRGPALFAAILAFGRALIKRQKAA